MYFVCRAMSGMKCLQGRAENVATLHKKPKLYSRLGLGRILRNGHFLCKLRVRKWKGKRGSNRKVNVGCVQNSRVCSVTLIYSNWFGRSIFMSLL